MFQNKRIWAIALLVFMTVGIVYGQFSLGFFKEPETITMQYDDYFSDERYSEVEIVSPGNPQSYKVGYGVPEKTKDDAVVSMKYGVLHASGIGTARVKLDGVEYIITVEPAPISMFLLIGQSNMYGTDGNADQSVANINGTAYSTLGNTAAFCVDNAAEFVPSALTGTGSRVNVKGTVENLQDNPVDRLTQIGMGKRGLDSAFAYRWHRLTGDKVWLINAAHGGTPVNTWKQGAKQYNEAVEIFKNAQQVMKNEILAGHYVLKNYGCLWLQGCSDRPRSAEYYIERFLSMYNGLKQDLLFDIDGDGRSETLNFFDIIIPRFGKNDCDGYRRGNSEQTTDKRFYQSFKDLEMSGARVAQYWLTNNPQYEDINLVCNIGDKWVYMPDGNNGVKDFFFSRYKDGKVNYPIQVQQDEKWYYPETPADVHDNIHYNQIGYNEIGFEAAQNAAYTHGRIAKPTDVKTTVTFYDWTGYRELSSIKACAAENSDCLVVPVVYPVYESKNVTYTVSGNMKYEYYDLISDSDEALGSLKATLGNETVKVLNVTKADK